MIENVGGAGGMTGANRVAKAAPDGYQFVLGSVGTHAQNQTLYKHPAYNAAKDFEPVILVGRDAAAAGDAQGLSRPTTCRSSSPTPRPIRASCKFGSAGAGSAIHLGCVLFNAAAGIKATHIPYRGGNPAMQDLIAGRIDYSCNIITSAYPAGARQADQGAGATCRRKRAPLLPDLATAQEQGMAGFDAGSWNVVFLPKGTPEPIVSKLNAAFSQALDTPATASGCTSSASTFRDKDRRTPGLRGEVRRRARSRNTRARSRPAAS